MADFEEQEQRIAKVLGKKAVPSVSHATLQKYLAYLKQAITLPCLLTGIEDFPWEERYVLGYGSKAEYERLKTTQPSYTDTYELVSFEDEEDDMRGLLVKVKRKSDKKNFVLPLAELKAVDEQSKNYELLHDFSVWFVNWN